MEGKAFLGYEDKKEFYFPLKNLRKHFFSLGSSGSGKTVLSKILIEEVALNGIPAIAVDPQGDLASLLLSGSAEDIKKHGLKPETLKKFNESVQVTVFTPVSSKGIPICLNPLDIGKVEEEEEIIPLLHQVSSSIVRLLGYLPNDKGKAAETILYTILRDKHAKGRKIGTFANLASMIENMDESLKEELKQFITNEKEFDALIRKIKFLTVGEKEILFNFGVPLDIDMLIGKGEKKTRVSVIYLNTLSTEEDKEFFLSILTTQIYQWMLQNPSPDLNFVYFIDEIAPFIPAGSEKPIPKPILKILFKQARKYGVSCLIATQNPGDIDYKAFAQFGTWAIGRLTVKQDQKKVENALKSLSEINISTQLPKLQPGNFLLFSPDISDDVIHLSSRWLYTQHRTLTDDDIKKATPIILREQYRPYMVKKKVIPKVVADEPTKTPQTETPIEKGIIEGSLKHFKLMVGEDEILALIEKNKKRHLLLGPKEDLISYKLNLKPIFWAQVTSSSKNLLRKLQHEQHDMLFDAKSGEIIVYRNKSFGKIVEFSKMIGLKENEIRILRFLTEQRAKFFPGDIAIKIRISKGAVTNSMKSLLKKKLATYEKVGKDMKYFSILDLPETRVNQVNSDKPILTMEKLKALVEKPKLKVKGIEDTFKSWFQDSILVSHELIYLPVYIIRYSGKRGIRKVEINGVTGKTLTESDI